MTSKENNVVCERIILGKPSEDTDVRDEPESEPSESPEPQTPEPAMSELSAKIAGRPPSEY